MTTTIAEQIANQFSNDGSRFTSASGIGMYEALSAHRNMTATVINGVNLFTFSDGSAIAIVYDAWYAIADIMSANLDDILGVHA